MYSRWIASARTFFEREPNAQTHFYEGCVVAVTGAGSGIGRELALQLSRHGSLIALADVDMAKVRGTRELCSAASDIEVFQVDVRDHDSVAAFAAGTVERFGRCDVLIANAGVLHVGSVEATTYSEFDDIMAVNFGGIVHSVKAFLPHLRATGRPARIAAVSSAVGLVGMPEHAAYSASKFAVRGFVESLRAELAKTNIEVTAVYPGGIRTSIARSAMLAADVDRDGVIERFENRVARTDADAAARAILAGVEAGRGRVLIGADAWLAEIAARLAGPHFDRIVSAVAKMA